MTAQQTIAQHRAYCDEIASLQPGEGDNSTEARTALRTIEARSQSLAKLEKKLERLGYLHLLPRRGKNHKPTCACPYCWWELEDTVRFQCEVSPDLKDRLKSAGRDAVLAVLEKNFPHQTA